jgi:hypothetical protein
MRTGSSDGVVENDLTLAREVVDSLRLAGLDIWLFGGWAEELRGMRASGPHADIDLLLRAATFDELEAFLSSQRHLIEIPEKRFSHKRAFLWRGVRVEVFLVQPHPLHQTVMFDGRVLIHWPNDTFAEGCAAGVPIASKAALALYRRDHRRVRHAYAAFRAARTSAGE